MRPFQGDGAGAEGNRLTPLHEKTAYLRWIADELNARVAEIRARSEQEELKRLEQELSEPQEPPSDVGTGPEFFGARRIGGE